jgi:hypothetical protein
MTKKRNRPKKAERQGRAEKRARDDDDVLVEDTVARVGCTVNTAEDMSAQCENRLEDIDVDLTFAWLAHDVWRDRTAGADLVKLIEELLAEQRRHGAAMHSLNERFLELCDREHEHIGDGEIDSAWVRKQIFTLPEDRPVDRQIPTDSGRR